MEGYLVAILDDGSSPKEYWTDNCFKDDVTQAKIYVDPKEAVSNFAGLQARYNTFELKVYKCRSIIEIIPGNPFAVIKEATELATTAQEAEETRAA